MWNSLSEPVTWIDNRAQMIETHRLTKYFGKTCAIQELSLHIPAGEIYGLVGPDGAGKTTCMRLLCGAIRPTAGTIRLAGQELSTRTTQGESADVSGHIGYLAQRFALYDELTVMENLRFFAQVRGLKADASQSRSREILEFVGLAPFADRRAGRLSGGMKQKLGLAVALVHRPRVLLLDEPTTGVDPITRQDFWRLIIQLVAQQQVTVLITTPYMDEAARCMRLGFLRRGRLMIEGSPAELRARLRGQVLELRGEDLPTLRSMVRRDPQVEDVQMFGDCVHIRIPSGQREVVMQRLRAQLQQAGRQTSIEEVEASLEDVFISLQQVQHE